MKKVKVDISLSLDSPLFCQLHTLSNDLVKSLDDVVSDLIDLSLYCVQHAYYPFDDWLEDESSRIYHSESDIDSETFFPLPFEDED